MEELRLKVDTPDSSKVDKKPELDLEKSRMSESKQLHFARIPKEEFEPVSLPSRSMQSFYITLTTDDLVYQHYLTDSENNMAYVDANDFVQASGPDLIVYKGASVLKYPLEFPATDFRSGGFIRLLFYEVDGEEIIPPPVSSVTY
jgi:hypothetical protein